MAFFGTLLSAINTISQAIDDPSDTLDSLIKTGASNVKKNNFSSIASKASEGILQFPVIISDSVDYNTAVTVTKALERNYSSFIETIISMNNTTGDLNTDNISDYLRRFHDNSMSASVDSDGRYGDDVSIQGFRDAAAGRYESAQLEYQKHLIQFNDPNNHKVEFTCELYYPNKVILHNTLKEELRYYLEAFCLEKLNDKYQPVKLENVGFTIAVNEAKSNKPSFNDYKKRNEDLEKENKELKEKNQDLRDKYNYERNKYEEKGSFDVDLLPNDVKKANELQPTFIKVTIKRADRDTRSFNEYNIIIGVKATLHLAKSQEYITNLVDACEYKGSLFRFIKWTTGEISFLKDYVLRMDEFSKEISGTVTNQSHWWEALKRRSREAKMSKVKTNRLLPNATFVFTMDEAEFIKANFGYDLLNKTVAKRLMKEYFLLGYVILDMPNEVAHILYDGQKDFQLMTFKNMEREGANAERQFKEILRATKRM